MTNILVTIPYLLHIYNHGNAIRIEYLVDGLENMGLGVTLFMYDLPWVHSRYRDRYMYLYPTKTEIILATALLKYLTKMPAYDPLCSFFSPIRFFRRRMLEAILKEDIHLVQVENLWPLPPTIKALRGRIPVVVTVHDVYSERYNELLRYNGTPRLLASILEMKIREIEIEYLNMADSVICLSEYDKGKYIKMGVNCSKIVVIPNGVDINKLKPTEPNKSLKSRLGIGEDDLVLFFAGSTMYQNKQAVDDLANIILPKVLERRKKVKLLITGGISSYVREKGYDSGLPIIPLGYVKDINQHYALADIVVIPTVLGTGSKLKTLEAMAAGKVIVCNSKAVRGIAVRNWQDIIIEDDFDTMIDSILYIANDVDTRLEIGLNARKLAEKYSWDKVCKRYINLYEKIIS